MMSSLAARKRAYLITTPIAAPFQLYETTGSISTNSISGGAAPQTGISGYMVSTPVIPSKNCQCLSIAVYLGSVAGNVQLSIYSDNAGLPGALLGYATPATAINGWNTLTLIVAPSLISGGRYWLTCQVDNNATGVYRFGAQAANTSAYAAQSYGSPPPATYPSPVTGASPYVLYANCQ